MDRYEGLLLSGGTLGLKTETRLDVADKECAAWAFTLNALLNDRIVDLVIPFTSGTSFEFSRGTITTSGTVMLTCTVWRKEK